MVEVPRRGAGTAAPVGSLPSLEPVLDVAAPSMPPGYSRAAADRLAAQALAGSAEARRSKRVGGAGDLLHAAAVIRSADGKPDRRRRRDRLPDRRNGGAVAPHDAGVRELQRSCAS